MIFDECQHRQRELHMKRRAFVEGCSALIANGANREVRIRNLRNCANGVHWRQFVRFVLICRGDRVAANVELERAKKLAQTSRSQPATAEYKYIERLLCSPSSLPFSGGCAACAAKGGARGSA